MNEQTQQDAIATNLESTIATTMDTADNSSLETQVSEPGLAKYMAKVAMQRVGEKAAEAYNWGRKWAKRGIKAPLYVTAGGLPAKAQGYLEAKLGKDYYNANHATLWNAWLTNAAIYGGTGAYVMQSGLPGPVKLGASIFLGGTYLIEGWVRSGKASERDYDYAYGRTAEDEEESVIRKKGAGSLLFSMPYHVAARVAEAPVWIGKAFNYVFSDLKSAAQEMREKEMNEKQAS